MMKTATQALNTAIAGDWKRAWEIAQQDEGLAADATFAQWQAWAIKAIESRYSLERSQAVPAAYHG
jgi:hypothetical protein